MYWEKYKTLKDFINKNIEIISIKNNDNYQERKIRLTFSSKLLHHINQKVKKKNNEYPDIEDYSKELMRGHLIKMTVGINEVEFLQLLEYFKKQNNSKYIDNILNKIINYIDYENNNTKNDF